MGGMVRGRKRIERLRWQGEREANCAGGSGCCWVPAFAGMTLGAGARGLIMALGPRLRGDDVRGWARAWGMVRGGTRIERLGWLGEREAMLRRD